MNLWAATSSKVPLTQDRGLSWKCTFLHSPKTAPHTGSYFYMLSALWLAITYVLRGGDLAPISQMEAWGLREFKPLAQLLTARKWQHWDFSLSLTPNCVLCFRFLFRSFKDTSGPCQYLSWGGWELPQQGWSSPASTSDGGGGGGEGGLLGTFPSLCGRASTRGGEDLLSCLGGKNAPLAFWSHILVISHPIKTGGQNQNSGGGRTSGFLCRKGLVPAVLLVYIGRWMEFLSWMPGVRVSHPLNSFSVLSWDREPHKIKKGLQCLLLSHPLPTSTSLLIRKEGSQPF